MPQSVGSFVKAWSYGCGDVEMFMRGWSIAQVLVADTISESQVLEPAFWRVS